MELHKATRRSRLSDISATYAASPALSLPPSLQDNNERQQGGARRRLLGQDNGRDARIDERFDVLRPPERTASPQLNGIGHASQTPQGTLYPPSSASDVQPSPSHHPWGHPPDGSLPRHVAPSPARAALPHHIHMPSMQPNHVHIYVEHDDAAHSSNVGTSANGRAASQGGSHWSSAGGAQGMEPANVLGAGGHMNFANEHMKVYTVPRSLQMEDNVVVETITRSLKGVKDKELEDRIAAEMNGLYEFFKQLYEHDQREISDLTEKLQAREQDLHRAHRKAQRSQAMPQQPNLHMEFHHHDASPKKSPRYRQGDTAPQRDARASKGTTNIVFLPPHINPSRPFFKWWALVHWHYEQHTFLWQAVAFFLLLILAIGLLAGLLSNRNTSTPAVALPVPPTFTTMPTLVGMTGSSVTFNASLNGPGTLFYALVPAAALPAARLRSLLQSESGAVATRKPSAADVFSAVYGQGLGSSYLSPLTTACGSRRVLSAGGQHTITLSAVSSTLSPECSSRASAAFGVCSLCPLVRPLTNYMLYVTAVPPGMDLAAMPLAALQSLQLFTPSDPVTSTHAASACPGCAPVPTFVDTSPFASASASGALNLHFTVDNPGSVVYAVMHARLYAQLSNAYAAFEAQQPADLLSLIQSALLPSGSPPSQLLPAGIIAVGSLTVSAARTAYTCTVGRADAAALSTCACGNENVCPIPAPCFSGLCSVSANALTPNTTYKVYLIPRGSDGKQSGSPVALPPISTAPSTLPPQLAKATGVDPIIGPSGFNIAGLQQDAQGFMYMLVTRPTDQGAQVEPGTATPFSAAGRSARRQMQISLSTALSIADTDKGGGRKQPGTAKSLGSDSHDNSMDDHVLVLRPQSRRRMAAVPATAVVSISDAAGVPLLPPAPTAPGSIFMPQCPASKTCDLSTVVRQYHTPATGSLVYSRCLAVDSATDVFPSTAISQLDGDTVYRVQVVTADLLGNQQSYTAIVKTVDNTPPTFVSVNATAQFTSFTLNTFLDEPSAVVGLLVRRADEVNVTLPQLLQGAFPPDVQGPILQTVLSAPTLPTTSLQYSLTFTTAIVSNTDYVVYLLARDQYNNVQAGFTRAEVHTADDQPPNWLAASVSAGGLHANLTAELDEPSMVFFRVLRTVAGSTVVCPTAEEVIGQGLQSEGLGSPFTVRGLLSTTSAVTVLTDSTSYILCVAAQDTTSYKNVQQQVQVLPFVTLDVTPPSITPVLNSIKCDRSSFQCIANITMTVSESCILNYALVPTAAYDAVLANTSAGWTPLSGPDLFAQSSSVRAAGPLMQAVQPYVSAQGELNFTSASRVPGSALMQSLMLPGLADQAFFLLLVATRDAAGNVNPLPITLNVTTPDIRPPTINATANGLDDFSLRVSIGLSEAGAVWYVAVASQLSMTPNVDQVMSAPVSNPNIYSAAGSMQYSLAPGIPAYTPVAFNVSGLVRGTVYDLFFVAQDRVGNLPSMPTSILGVRTADSTPPIIHSLTTTTSTSGNTFLITLNASKPGILYYVATSAGQASPARIDQLLRPRPTHGFNLSGSMAVASDSNIAQTTLCVADGRSLQLWAVLQDLEGSFPGRVPNNSTMVRATQVLLTPTTTCSSANPAARLSSLLFDLLPNTTTNLLPVGMLTPLLTGVSSAGGSGNEGIWYHDFMPFQRVPAAAAAAPTLAASGARLLAQLPGGNTLGFADIAIPRPPVASINVVLRTPTLYTEANDMVGRTLRFAYQLTNARGGIFMDVSGISVVPIVRPAAASGGPAGLFSVLQACDGPGAGGIGACEVVVGPIMFPSAGQDGSMDFQVQVLNGGSLLAQSAVLAVALVGAPLHPPFVPSRVTTPGLLVTLPYRPLHAGEVFKVTLTGITPNNQMMTGFSVSIGFLSSRVMLMSSTASALWGGVAMSPLPAPDFATTGRQLLFISALQRTSTDNMYTGTSIALADLTFRLITQAPQGAAALFSLGASNSQLYPFADQPQVAFDDYRTDLQNSTGSVLVAAVRPLAMLAYADTDDVLNTAVLTGTPLVNAIQATLVTTQSMEPVDLTSSGSNVSCTVSASVHTVLEVNGCSITVRSTHTSPGKAVPVRVQYGLLPPINVVVSVWVPSAIQLQPQDSTLNSVLPINTLLNPANCMNRFQSTRLRVLSTWANGGPDPLDSVPSVDVASLVTLFSNDTKALQLQGVYAQGLAARPAVAVAALGAGSRLLAAAIISVSDKPVCVVSLDTLAVTAVRVSDAPSTLSAANVLTPAASAIRVMITAEQAFNWEGTRAMLQTIATFTDGTSSDVTDSAFVTYTPRSSLPVLGSTIPAEGSLLAGLPLPFRLSGGSGMRQQAALNVTFGSAEQCGEMLASTWSVCSTLPVAQGTGLVHIAMPSPVSISALLIQPPSITSTLDGASQAPISVPTSASMAVMVSFTDGSIRDFARDPRVVLQIMQGSDLCTLAPADATGARSLLARTSSTASGVCAVQATLSLPGSPPLTALNFTRVVGLAALSVYAYPGLVAAAPSLDAAEQRGLVLAGGAGVRLLKCDFANYEQMSIFTLGRLSNCSSGCSQLDVTSPLYTNFTTADTSMAVVFANSASAQLNNLLVAKQSGTTQLTASFGRVRTSVGVSVEETFQPGWPRVLHVNDTAIQLGANMTGSFTLTYMAVTARQYNPASPPTAAAIEQGGVALSLSPSAFSPPNAHYYEEWITGLSPATNYTLLLAVRSGATLVRSVLALSGVLTPDTAAPTFSTIGHMLSLSQDTQLFNLRLPIAVNEPSVLHYAVYRRVSCISAEPSIEELRSAARLPASKCACTSRTDCDPVAYGNDTLAEGVLANVYTIQGLVPPNPFDFLRGAGEQLLTCRNVSLPSYASQQHTLYLAAEDDLPTYRNWSLSCSGPSTRAEAIALNGGAAACGPVTSLPCRAVPPAVQSNNVQALPYARLTLSATDGFTGQPQRPIAATFSLPLGADIGFDQASVSVTSQSRSITFTFKVNRPSLIEYRVDTFSLLTVFSGVYPVFDTSVPYSLSVSKTCAGAPLSDSAYVVWYRATDVYGNQSPAMPLRAPMA